MWLRIDESSDVILSLSQCLRSVRLLEHEPGNWKWAIISLHNAVQGAMACHLSGSAQLGALSERSRNDWLAWYEKDLRGEIKRVERGPSVFGVRQSEFATAADHPPKPWLADPLELLRRLGNQDRRGEAGAGAALNIEQAEQRAFRKLNDLRKSFAHFTPMGWSLELSGLPAIFALVIGLLQKIASDPYPFRHMPPDQKSLLTGTLAELRTNISNLPQHSAR